MNVVVVLPTYNERDNITQLLKALSEKTQGIKGYGFKFLVVDDSSPDGTGDLVKQYQKANKNTYLLSGKKQGLGKALLRGLTYAVEELKADILVQMDADLSHDPKSLPEFFERLDAGADYVVGSRYIPGGSIPDNWGIHRKIFSVVGNGIVRYGLGVMAVHDWTGGYRAYRKEYFLRSRARLERYSGYVFQIAFLHNAIKLGAKVGEVPINFTDRRYGRSKIAPSEYIRNVLEYVGRERIKSMQEGTFGKFLIVGSVGFIINTVLLELIVAIWKTPVLGSIIGAECAIISNFFLNNGWTFRERRIKERGILPKLLQFNITSLGALVIQGISVFIGTGLFGLGVYRLFYVLGVCIGLVWNYIMYSKVIWKTGN